MALKLDILAFAAHPDDAELSCTGTIMAHIAQGKKAGICDLTRGELGTRGTVEIRAKEVEASSKILNIHARENLGLPDGFMKNEEEHLLPLIKALRKYQPEIVLCNAIDDRHPDHGLSAIIEERACFLAGLSKIVTTDNGVEQQAWRPKSVFHYIQDRYINPDLIIDITPYFERKMEAIRAFKSQFYDPSGSEPNTYISSPDFLENIETRAREYGRAVGVKYGEGYTTKRKVGVKSLFDLL